jgi:hypothetical protein
MMTRQEVYLAMTATLTIQSLRTVPRLFNPRILDQDTFALRTLTKRQLEGFVHGDDVTASTRDHVDGTYLTVLDRRQAIFAPRPHVLGDAPTIADFGLIGPMLRHFGQDPTPAEIMRNGAPAFYEWMARMWNTKSSNRLPEFVDEIDDVLQELQRAWGDLDDRTCEILRSHKEQAHK